MRVLVVDDERNYLHEFFDKTVSQNLELEFSYFLDDEESILSFVRNHEVDYAFLDINMPSVDGFRLAGSILSVRKNVKIVYVTGLVVDWEDLPASIAPSVVKIIHKPLDAMELSCFFSTLTNEARRLRAMMFGTFDCFMGNIAVRFASSKAKELFALLLSMRGKTLTMEHAITCLWPDKDIDKARILYRDAVWRLRSVLKEIGFDGVTFLKGKMTLDTSKIDCDYYRFLDGDHSLFQSEFLLDYEWSLPLQSRNEALIKGFIS